MSPIKVNVAVPKKDFIPFIFPPAAALGIPDKDGVKQGQKVAKEAIYQQVKPTNAVKQIFVEQVESIVWRYKLSAETLNVAESEDVAEIQVFDIQLKQGSESLDIAVLEALDKAIPSTVFFRVFRSESRSMIQCAMAYKRANKRDDSVMVIDEYFFSEWIPLPKQDEAFQSQKLPLVVNMSGLHRELLRSLLPVPPREGEKLETQLERIRGIKVLQTQLAQAKIKLQREKQFNRKVEINHQVNQLKLQINALFE
ncbi:DUF4391 domain-containing protein [Vibrio rhizosphaerae]|uniref:DUF4391 domain-containing protein n=1 Tax=Vibrio rhizosphaerae TaxID=398736 RepID=UPI00068EF40C|nr:DUF4391 domain-containing protein [Vibrio rhizosphaerae]